MTNVAVSRGDDSSTFVVVLNVHDAHATIVEAFQWDETSAVARSAGPDEIRAMLSTVEPATPQSAPPRMPAFGLTGREREVLSMLGGGVSARRIATALGISERTVNSHVLNGYRKLGVTNRVDAVREAMRLGIVDVPHY